MPTHTAVAELPADVVTELQNRNEKVNTFYRFMAHRPEVLRAYLPFQNAVMSTGALTPRVKIMAYLAASYVNECPYCVAHYTELAKQNDLSQEEIRAIQIEQDQDFPPVEHAALHIARELTRTCSMDDVHESEMILFSSEELVELITVISLANFNNRFNNALDIEYEH